MSETTGRTHNPGAQPHKELTCPLCGEQWKNLPQHLEGCASE